MLGENLKKLRKASGFNQEEVARFLGVDRSAYSYYESGKSEPKLANLIKLAKLFGVGTDQLIGAQSSEAVLGLNNDSECKYDAGFNNIPETLGKCTDEEKALLAYFRLLDDKQAVLDFLVQQYNQQEMGEPE